MFNFFKKKSKVEVLDRKYKRLLNEAYKLSTINRKASDEKTAEANLVLEEIEKLKSEHSI